MERMADWMGKNRFSMEVVIMEIVSAVAGLFYIGLQVYYGIVYGAVAMRVIMNVLVMLLVYAGLTMMLIYPEHVNGLKREVCTGVIRKYTVRMVSVIKLICVLALLFSSICDALGYRVDGAYSLVAVALIVIVAVYYEGKIIRIFRSRK